MLARRSTASRTKGAAVRQVADDGPVEQTEKVNLGQKRQPWERYVNARSAFASWTLGAFGAGAARRIRLPSAREADVDLLGGETGLHTNCQTRSVPKSSRLGIPILQ